jgi:hypothetical protein
MYFLIIVYKYNLLCKKNLNPQHNPADKCAYPVKLEYLVAPLAAGTVTE